MSGENCTDFLTGKKQWERVETVENFLTIYEILKKPNPNWGERSTTKILDGKLEIKALQVKEL